MNNNDSPIICITVLSLPCIDAGITLCSLDALTLNPSTSKSLVTNMITSHTGILVCTANIIKTMLINSLSAIGSNIFPNVVT